MLKLVLFGQLAHAPFNGDETAYVNSARALSNLVRDLAGLGPLDVVELQRNVVASGWFMPGMPVLLTPLFVVDPDASVTAIRVYLGVVTFLFLILAIVSVRRCSATSTQWCCWYSQAWCRCGWSSRTRPMPICVPG